MAAEAPGAPAAGADAGARNPFAGFASRLRIELVSLKDAALDSDAAAQLRAAASNAKAQVISADLSLDTLGDKAKAAAASAKAKASAAADRVEAGAVAAAHGVARAGSSLAASANDGLARVQSLTHERLLTFFMLSFAAAVLLVLAFFVGLPAAALAPAKFAVPFTLGSLLNLGALAALRGVRGQMEHMAAPERLPLSALYCGSMLLTIWATFVMHSYILCVLASLVQLAALLFYSVSYFPGGVAGAKLVSMSAGRVLRPALGACASATGSCFAEARETRSLSDLLPI